MCSGSPQLLAQLLRNCMDLQDEAANATLALLLGHLALTRGSLGLLLDTAAAATREDLRIPDPRGAAAAADAPTADVPGAEAAASRSSVTLLHLLAHEVAVSPQVLYGDSSGAHPCGMSAAQAVPAVMRSLAAVVLRACQLCEAPARCIHADAGSDGPAGDDCSAAPYVLEAALRVRHALLWGTQHA